jgi:hypothetical protein
MERRIGFAFLAAGMTALASAPVMPMEAATAKRLAKPDRASLARAVDAIARGPHLADPSAVEHILGLSGLAAGIQWVEPPSWQRMAGPTGSFAPRGGASGISRLVFRKRELLFRGGGYVAHDWLTLSFRKGMCPALRDYEAAFGTKAREMMIPIPHHDARRRHVYFELPAANGVQVSVSVEPCAVHLNAPSGAGQGQ